MASVFVPLKTVFFLSPAPPTFTAASLAFQFHPYALLFSPFPRLIYIFTLAENLTHAIYSQFLRLFGFSFLKLMQISPQRIVVSLFWRPPSHVTYNICLFKNINMSMGTPPVETNTRLLPFPSLRNVFDSHTFLKPLVAFCIPSEMGERRTKTQTIAINACVTMICHFWSWRMLHVIACASAGDR